MHMLILAGGAGTRLRSAVPDLPKALAPIGDMPFLAFQLSNWKRQGIRKFTFLLHYQADMIIGFLESAKEELLADCAVDWTLEPTPLDTGGAVAFAIRKNEIDDMFLLTNADTWLGGGITQVAEAPSPAIAVLHRDDASRYGRVETHADGRVCSFLEKGTDGPGMISAGLSKLSPELFETWSGGPLSLERDCYPDWAAQGRLQAVPINVSFIDIGTPQDYRLFVDTFEA